MMTPEQVATKVLVEHSIRPDWRRTGEQIHSLIVEAIKMDRAQRERDHGHAPVETITSIRRQIWGIEP